MKCLQVLQQGQDPNTQLKARSYKQESLQISPPPPFCSLLVVSLFQQVQVRWDALLGCPSTSPEMKLTVL